MTKVRVPGSIEDAVDLTVGALTMERVRELTGKSKTIIENWRNPDSDAYAIPLRACALLDREMLLNGERALFKLWLEENLAQHGPLAAETVEPPLVQSMHVVTTAARTLEETEVALKDGEIDPAERVALLRATEDLQRRIAKFRRGLFIKPARPGK